VTDLLAAIFVAFNYAFTIMSCNSLFATKLHVVVTGHLEDMNVNL